MGGACAGQFIEKCFSKPYYKTMALCTVAKEDRAKQGFKKDFRHNTFSCPIEKNRTGKDMFLFTLEGVWMMDHYITNFNVGFRTIISNWIRSV